MDKKSRLLLALAVIGSVLAIGVTYNQIFILGDYELEIVTPCDPNVESCFVLTPECIDGKECVDEPIYQKIVRTRASHVPDECRMDTANCETTICDIGDTSCSYILCESAEGEPFQETLGVCSTGEDRISGEENMVEYEL